MEEKSFEELYQESLNSKRFNKTVTGTVIQISSKKEIYVDFGYKADGIIPYAEYSDEEGKNPNNEFKAGDTITADILKWNDGLGNVLLSYKKYIRRENAIKQKELKVKQAEERKEQRKIREQEKIDKAKSIEEFWNQLQIGQTYTGTISKIAEYGLFVDLGLVRGLLHKSEIVWNKDETLENKFQVGEEINVTIKSFDKVEGKISLAYPNKEENPWYSFVEKYNVGDVVTCEVVKFAPFGAFVELEKGLEGLVHNSEITSLKRVTKPEEVLALGQMINAKIINIDKEKCKIGLTIKELEGTTQEYGYEEYIKGEENNEQ